MSQTFNEICVKEVIVSQLSRRGTGRELDPVRIVTEVFEKNGTLIAWKDPYDGNKFVQGDLVNFARWCVTTGNTAPAYGDVIKWLAEIEKKDA